VPTCDRRHGPPRGATSRAAAKAVAATAWATRTRSLTSERRRPEAATASVSDSAWAAGVTSLLSDLGHEVPDGTPAKPADHHPRGPG
jgi:hypothetical protein